MPRIRAGNVAGYHFYGEFRDKPAKIPKIRVAGLIIRKSKPLNLFEDKSKRYQEYRELYIKHHGTTFGLEADKRITGLKDKIARLKLLIK